MAHLIVVAGPAGCGKTTWTYARVKDARRLVVVDPLGEWDVGGVAYGLRDCLSRLLDLQGARVPRFRLACRLPTYDADEVLRALWGFQVDFARFDPRRLVTVVVDEADRVSRPGDRDTGLDLLIQYGRRVADPCYLLTRRLARVSRDATANAGSLVMFKTTEPTDLRDLMERRGRQAADQVRALEEHAWVQL